MPLQGQYTIEDRKRALASQPLNVLPPYLAPKPDELYNPPLLHCGWILNIHKLFEFIKEHFRELALYEGTPPRPDFIKTFTRCTFLSTFLELLKIPNRSSYRARIHITLVCDGIQRSNPSGQEDFNSFIGLVVGTNYNGCVSKKVIERLNAFFAPGVPPRWFLDLHDWKWWKPRARSKSSKRRPEATKDQLEQMDGLMPMKRRRKD